MMAPFVGKERAAIRQEVLQRYLKDSIHPTLGTFNVDKFVQAVESSGSAAIFGKQYKALVGLNELMKLNAQALAAGKGGRLMGELAGLGAGGGAVAAGVGGQAIAAGVGFKALAKLSEKGPLQRMLVNAAAAKDNPDVLNYIMKKFIPLAASRGVILESGIIRELDDDQQPNKTKAPVNRNTTTY